MEENAHEQRGKQNKAGNNTNINTFPIKIKILLAHLEKLLYLCAVFWKKRSWVVRFGRENRITYREALQMVANGT